MQLFRYLQLQGLGSKKQCIQWIEDAQVMVNQQVIDNSKAEIIPQDIQQLTVCGQEICRVSLPFFYLLLHKPAGYETSHQPQHYPSVFSLLPDNIRQLKPQAVGRLDADTTGLLLITNDGQYNHHLTAPRHHIRKIYEVTLKHRTDTQLVSQLLTGVLLKDEALPSCATHAFLRDPKLLSLEIEEGKYHQVKRMVAAAGNRVVQLHRTHFGPYSLDSLPQGQWLFVEKA